MTNKFIRFIKENRIGLGAGAFVGLAVAAVYKFTGGDFMFAVANIQGRAANPFAILSQAETFSVVSALTLVAWVVLGAIIGIFIDKKFGLKLSQKTKNWILIISILLLGYYLFGDGLGRAGGPGSGRPGTLASLGKMGWPFATLVGIIFTSVFGIFKAFAPQPQIPIWIFFVVGFMLLLMFRKRGGEQPIVIQR